MNIAGAIEAIRQKLSRGTSAVSAGLADLRDRISEKREELRHAERAPLPIEDLAPRIAARVEADGDAWLARFGGQLVAGERSIGRWSPRNVVLPEVGGWGAICAADPEAAASHLEALIAGALERHPPGVPLGERQRLVERLQSELGQLDEAEEGLVDEANILGLDLAHRPEVLRRREAAKRAAQNAIRLAAVESAADDGRSRSREVVLGPNGELRGSRAARSEYIERAGALPATTR